KVAERREPDPGNHRAERPQCVWFPAQRPSHIARRLPGERTQDEVTLGGQVGGRADPPEDPDLLSVDEVATPPEVAPGHALLGNEVAHNRVWGVTEAVHAVALGQPHAQ